LNVLYASNDNPLPITEEAVKQADDLAQEVTESIIRILKEDKLYYESPQKLSRIVRDIWGGQKYRADGFVRTFTADVAGATTLNRYKQQGIEEFQFYAKIDERTTPQCRSLHGTVFRTGSPEADKYRAPCHIRCRSTVIPVTMFTEVKDSWRYENRDFSKPMNHDFSFSSTEIDSKIVKQVFKNIDTFNEKYRIDRWIFDEDLEKRYMRLGVGIDVNAPKPPITKTPKIKEEVKKEEGLKYVPVKTAKEAEEWVLKNTSITHVNFKGLNIDVINQMNESLAYHINLDPRITEKLKYFGTTQGQYYLEYMERVKEDAKSLVNIYKKNPSWVEGKDYETAFAYAKKTVKMQHTDAYAHNWDVSLRGYDFSGIAVNRKWGQANGVLEERLLNDSIKKWHPEGCDNFKSIIDHEFAHAMDEVHNLKMNPEIYRVFSETDRFEKADILSLYSGTSEEEFLAEAWAEYLNNPNPRPLAKQIGDFIVTKVKEVKK
jgi:SPP1 gp7 family putative phage head morphogenesis protein